MDAAKFEPLGGGVGVFTAKNHRVNTDSVLLAAFCTPRAHERACDLGTGCGVIPLLWFSRGGPAYAAGVEIMPEAAELCRRSIEHGGLAGRFELIRGDLRRLSLRAGTFDLVCMNPPYRRTGTGILSKSEAGRAARFEAACAFPEIAAAARRLLRHGGRFCLCHRPERLPEILRALSDAGLEPKRLRLVQDSAGKAPFLFLLEAKKGAQPSLRVATALILRDGDGRYTAEARELCGDHGAGGSGG